MIFYSKNRDTIKTMGATKIINVLKDDRFEEILDILKGADASEIIFVLPKKARAFKSEAQFAALEEEIKNSGKSVAFLCSDPEINGLAKKYNFEVLSTTTIETVHTRSYLPLSLPWTRKSSLILSPLKRRRSSPCFSS